MDQDGDAVAGMLADAVGFAGHTNENGVDAPDPEGAIEFLALCDGGAPVLFAGDDHGRSTDLLDMEDGRTLDVVVRLFPLPAPAIE